MSKDANSFGHDKALAWESRGFVYTQKRMHRFDTPSKIAIDSWIIASCVGAKKEGVVFHTFFHINMNL